MPRRGRGYLTWAGYLTRAGYLTWAGYLTRARVPHAGKRHNQTHKSPHNAPTRITRVLNTALKGHLMRLGAI